MAKKRKLCVRCHVRPSMKGFKKGQELCQQCWNELAYGVKSKGNARQCNPPFDLTRLNQLVGKTPIKAKIQKVAGQIQLRIEKPSNELLHKLGLRKSKNPAGNIPLTNFQLGVLQEMRRQRLDWVAAATEEHWRNGESYYIDARVPARGIRRKFEQGNKQAIAAGRALSKNPRSRNLPKFTDHIYESYLMAQAADNVATGLRSGMVKKPTKGLIPSSLYAVPLAGKWAVVGDSPVSNPRKSWFALSTLSKMEPYQFRSVLEQELYAGIPGDRAIPSKPSLLAQARDVAAYAGSGYSVVKKGGRYVFRIAPKSQRGRGLGYLP